MAIPVQFEDYFNIVTKNLQRMDGYLIPDWFLDQMTMKKGKKKDVFMDCGKFSFSSSKRSSWNQNTFANVFFVVYLFGSNMAWEEEI